MKAITALVFLALAGSAAAQAAANAEEALKSAGRFNSFLAAADKAGLTPVLQDPNANITLFVPNDEAFAKLPAGTEAPKDLLLYHGIEGGLDNLKLHDSVTEQGRVWRLGGGPFPSLADGAPLKITEGAGPKPPLYANGQVVNPIDLKGGATVIQELDTVLTPPPELAAKIAAEAKAAPAAEAAAPAAEAAAPAAGEAAAPAAEAAAPAAEAAAPAAAGEAAAPAAAGEAAAPAAAGEAAAPAAEAAANATDAAVAKAGEAAANATEAVKAEVTKAVAAANETAAAAVANATEAVAAGLNATLKDAAAAVQSKLTSGAAGLAATALLAAVPAVLALVMA